jgi:hypothetical protein
MTAIAYRMYCQSESCDETTVVRQDESVRDTYWVVNSFTQHDGTCPECNPKIDVSEIKDSKGEKEREEIELTKLDGIGATAASNLQQSRLRTVEDVNEASDEKILSVDWVGQKGLESLREYVDKRSA